MSFILDALRKSEQQRQHGMAPTLATAPQQSHQIDASGKPVWPLSALIALLILAAGTAIGWLRPWQPAVPATPPRIANAPIHQAPEATSTVAEVIPPTAPIVPPASTPAEIKASITTSGPVLAPAALPSPVPTKDDGMPLPKIALTVHAYSSDPADRLAGINGKIVREGELLEPGLKLERITPDGVILNFRGRRLRHDLR